MSFRKSGPSSGAGDYYDRPRVGINNLRRSSFDDLIIAQKTFGFSLSSYEGVSKLRNRTITAGAGAVTSGDFGEINLSTGAAGDGSVALATNRRGVYYPGGQIETGIGIRMPTAPTGNQDVRWGYSSETVTNGAGFGMDADGLYIWLARDGADLFKIYQSDWNVDALDGKGPSGINLDVSLGCIYQIDFVWYGYGPISWSVACVNDADEESTSGIRLENNKITCHRFLTQRGDFDFSGPHLTIPNQPIVCRADNNGTASDLTVDVGGRQCSIIGVAEDQRVFRNVIEPVVDYSVTAAEGTWVPIVALRRKNVFSGGENPTNSTLTGVRITADAPVSMRTIWGADVSSTGWRDPTTWGAESAVEVQTTADSLAATAGTGVQTPPFEVLRPGTRPQTSFPVSAEGQTPIIFGRDEPIVIFVRRDSADATDVSVITEWREEW